MGFEPTTPFGAPDFESGRWPIRLPSGRGPWKGPTREGFYQPRSRASTSPISDVAASGKTRRLGLAGSEWIRPARPFRLAGAGA